jgi:hypothetical protein
MAQHAAEKSASKHHLSMQLEHENYSYNKYRMEVQGTFIHDRGGKIR